MYQAIHSELPLEAALPLAWLAQSYVMQEKDEAALAVLPQVLDIVQRNPETHHAEVGTRAQQLADELSRLAGVYETRGDIGRSDPLRRYAETLRTAAHRDVTALDPTKTKPSKEPQTTIRTQVGGGGP
jgi:hypothetical protein